MTGASDKSDRAGGLRPEPVAPSQPEALIPCAAPGDHSMCDCIVAHARFIMRYWTGTNCTWVDDDITALGILAGHAIRAGLHHDAAVPDSLIRCIDQHAQAIEARSAETAKLGSVEDESAVPNGMRPDDGDVSERVS